MNLNDKQADELVGHLHDLETLKRRTVLRLIKILREADKDIIAQLNSAGITEYQARRVNALAKDIREILRAAYIKIGDEFAGDLEDLVRSEIDYKVNNVNKAVGVSFATAPSINQVYTAAYARPFQGKLLKEHFKNLPDRMGGLIAAQIRLGYFEGETQNQINARVNRILKKRQPNEFRALVNTSIKHYQSFALRRFYETNAHAYSALKLVATLDTKTSDICIERDGRTWPVKSAPHLPFHFNERSEYIGILKAADEQRFDVPEGTRASMDGQEPQDIVYTDWIDNASLTRKRQALGANKGRLIHETDLSSSDLFVTSGKTPRKLLDAEVKAKFPEQWESVFGG